MPGAEGSHDVGQRVAAAAQAHAAAAAIAAYVSIPAAVGPGLHRSGGVTGATRPGEVQAVE
jgi:hypothetical protein